MSDVRRTEVERTNDEKFSGSVRTLTENPGNQGVANRAYRISPIRAHEPKDHHKQVTTERPSLRADLWPQLFSDVNCIALWISSEKILTRLYSVLHWFHKRLEANVKNPRENRCFQTIIVFSFGSFYNSNKCTVL